MRLIFCFCILCLLQTLLAKPRPGLSHERTFSGREFSDEEYGTDDYSDDGSEAYEWEEDVNDYSTMDELDAESDVTDDDGSDDGIDRLVAAHFEKSQLSLTALSSRFVNEVKGFSNQVVRQGAAAMREAKGYFSSDWEHILLQATKPTDTRPEAELVELMLGTVQTFVLNPDIGDAHNPYRTTLRKLWNKMAERDWRTKTKALYMFHMLIAHTQPEDAVILKELFDKMGREPSGKQRVRYFSKPRLLEMSDVTEGREATLELAPFIEAYATFVLKRATMFTSQFEELLLLADGTPFSADDVIAQLLKAKKLLTAALACAMSAECESDVTMACLDGVVRDVHVLFRQFDAKLRWVTSRRAVLFKKWDEDEVSKLLDHFIKFRVEKEAPTEAFLRDSAALLELYGSEVVPKSLHLQPWEV